MVKDKTIQCPRCFMTMKKITRENVTIDKCPECEGMWLDKGELQELSKLAKRYAHPR